jgi:hypothetical protein
VREEKRRCNSCQGNPTFSRFKGKTRLPFFIHEWAMKKDLIEEI